MPITKNNSLSGSKVYARKSKIICFFVSGMDDLLYDRNPVAYMEMMDCLLC